MISFHKLKRQTKKKGRKKEDLGEKSDFWRPKTDDLTTRGKETLLFGL
jgi:hypothetical protein